MASPREQESGMVARLADKTGHTLDEWVEIVRGAGVTAHGQVVRMLKTDYGVTHGYANLIAHKTLGSDAASLAAHTDLVEAQYTGARAAVRPIYDAVLRAVSSFGDDVEVAPKKSYVSLRRSKQFALLQPAAARLDVGLNLKGEPATDRLEPAGSFNAMCTHRVRVSSSEQVDAQLADWLRAAYDRA